MEGEKLKIKMSKKTVSYYLVNKQYKKEFEQLMNQCEKMYRKNYYEILRYCKKRNGEIVNLQFGEKFSLKFIALFDKARKEAEKNYKVKLGFANSNGFYMCDLSSFGIYSFSNLVGFIKSNKNFVIEDERGSVINVAEMKRLVLVKGEHLHTREAMNAERRRKIDKALDILRDVLSEEEVVKDNLEEHFSGTTRYQEIEDICDALDEAISTLEDI